MPTPSSADLRIEPLNPTHDRTAFSCGVHSLDVYLKTQAGQDMRRKANAVFVLVHAKAPTRVLGYVTLCATTERHGQGLGGILLAHALRKAYESAESVGSSLVVVDALNDTAACFYAAHGFVRLPESKRLILPMRVIGTLLDP